MISKLLDRGTLNITEDVFSLITSIAIEDVDGVVGTVSGIRDELTRVWQKKGNQRGIIIEENEQNEVTVHVKIAVHYGTNIIQACHEVQQRVKQEIEVMTGVAVGAVHIIVDQLAFEEN
jgi:uncharacterized alkaline shock family protein YloU